MLTVEMARLGLEPGARVLDLGCGEGRHLMQTRLLDGVIGVGVDIGRTETARARERMASMDELPRELGGAATAAGAWGVMRGSAYDLPFADASFDCVIVSEVLEHLEHDEDALREIRRVLRPRGTLAVSVPREGPEEICWVLSWKYRNSPGGHVRIYRGDLLPRLLERAGYRVRESGYAHALHTPYWWLKCALGLDNDDAWPVKLYHRLLVWDLMQKPWITRTLENALNPFIGKSVVFYATRSEAA